MHWISGVYRNDVFVNVILVNVVQVTVMKIVNMAVMADRRMPAIRAMLVGMVWMMLYSPQVVMVRFPCSFAIRSGTECHLPSVACSMAFCISSRTCLSERL